MAKYHPVFEMLLWPQQTMKILALSGLLYHGYEAFPDWRKAVILQNHKVQKAFLTNIGDIFICLPQATNLKKRASQWLECNQSRWIVQC